MLHLLGVHDRAHVRAVRAHVLRVLHSEVAAREQVVSDVSSAGAERAGEVVRARQVSRADDATGARAGGV